MIGPLCPPPPVSRGMADGGWLPTAAVKPSLCARRLQSDWGEPRGLSEMPSMSRGLWSETHHRRTALQEIHPAEARPRDPGRDSTPEIPGSDSTSESRGRDAASEIQPVTRSQRSRQRSGRSQRSSQSKSLHIS